MYYFEKSHGPGNNFTNKNNSHTTKVDHLLNMTKLQKIKEAL